MDCMWGSKSWARTSRSITNALHTFFLTSVLSSNAASKSPYTHTHCVSSGLDTPVHSTDLDEGQYIGDQSWRLIHYELIDTSYGMRLDSWTTVTKELNELG